MLKRYSFYGVSLELITVMGFFAALLILIFIAARREAVRSTGQSAAHRGKRGRRT